MLEYLFLRGFDLGERSLNGDDERLGATEYVGLVGGNERVDGADHLAASILALGALKELDAACGASRHGDRHAATREVLTRRATHGTRGHGGRHQPKRHALAAAHDGGQHHVCRGAQQDEHNALGRLLERLEQCVGGVGAQLLGTVDDVDLGLGADGRQRHVVEQLAGLGNEVARGALGRVIVHVGMCVPRNAHAAVARTTAVLLAQECLGKRPCGVELTGAGRAQEQVGVRCAAACDGVGQKVAHALLGVELGQQACLRGGHVTQPPGQARRRRHLGECRDRTREPARPFA